VYTGQRGIEDNPVVTFKNLLSMASLKVNLVWKRRLGNSATILFLINRYTPYFYVFMAFEGKVFPCSTYDADYKAFQNIGFLRTLKM
jgi:hypothetical protein